jgi:hypothetical protein
VVCGVLFAARGCAAFDDVPATPRKRRNESHDLEWFTSNVHTPRNAAVGAPLSKGTCFR